MAKQIAPKFEHKALERRLLSLYTLERPSSRIPRLERHKRKWCRWRKVKYRETDKCHTQQKWTTCCNVDKNTIEHVLLPTLFKAVNNIVQSFLPCKLSNSSEQGRRENSRRPGQNYNWGPYDVVIFKQGKHLEKLQISASWVSRC